MGMITLDNASNCGTMMEDLSQLLNEMAFSLMLREIKYGRNSSFMGSMEFALTGLVDAFLMS